MTRLAMTLTVIVLTMFASVSYADSEAFDKQMQPILEQYLKIPRALAADKTDGVILAAKEIAKLAAKLDASGVTGEHSAHYKTIPQTIVTAATKLASATDIAAMREALKDLSKPMAMWATMSKLKGISVMFCSMAPGSWLQRDDVTISNPYYGSQMLRCGEIVSGDGASAGDGGMKGK